MVNLCAGAGKNILDFCCNYEDYLNDTKDFSEVMQKALDSGERILYLPNGHYKIHKPLFIHSNTTLVLENNARICLADNSMRKRGDFLLSNSLKEQGNENIRVYGGIWDGNNQFNRKGELFDQNGYSGTLLCFMNVKNLVLSGMKLHNAAAFYTRLGTIDSFLIEDIEFSADNYASNNDGIHLGGFCENGVIRNLRAVTKGATSDDMIAINADDHVTRVENLDMKCGYIRNIYIDNLYAEDCHTFIRMLSIDSKISNIHINNVKGGCRLYVINMDGARYCRTPIISKDDERYLHGAGNIENVTVKNIDIINTSGINRPLIILESNMNNFEIINFKCENNCENQTCVTLNIGKIGKTSLKLTGITNEQLKIMEPNSSISSLSQKTLSDGKIDIEGMTDDLDYLILPFGGFDYLRAG